MAFDQEAITQQLNLLAAHRRTLAILLQQLALLGGVAYATPDVINGIEEARANIARIKTTLRENGSKFDDEPNDEAPPGLEPSKALAETPSKILNQPNWAVSGNVYNVAGSTVTGNVIGHQFVYQAVALAPALHQLRAPTSDFVGREQEIDQLVRALAQISGAVATISGVRGMGGIGKTELAYVVADQLKYTYADAQLVVELGGASSNPLTAKQALLTVIHSFGRKTEGDEDLGRLQGIFRSMLTDKRVLILADDAGNVSQVRPLLPPPGCALLITSRNKFSLPGMKTLDLATLPSAEAAILLQEICPRIGAYAEELAKLCGYLPLALRASASLLKENQSHNVEGYLEELRQERLKNLTDPDNADDPHASVEASLRLSYDALDRIHRSVLCQTSVFSGSFDLAAAEAVIVAKGAVRDTLDALTRRSLLEWDNVARRYNLHDLVRAFGKARLDDSEEVWLRYIDHYAQIAARTHQLYIQGGTQIEAGLLLFDTERRHMDEAWQWLLAQAPSEIIDTLLLAYADATTDIGALRYSMQPDRLAQFRATAKAAKRLGRSDDQARALCYIGVAYKNLGHPRHAMRFYKMQLAVARASNNRYQEGDALGNLGVAHKNLGNIHTALTLYRQYLSIAQEIGDKRMEADALSDLGIAYNLLGETHQAIEAHTQQLEITVAIGDRKIEANALGNLGKAFATLGRRDQAITCYEKDLAITQAIGDRRGEGLVRGNLGLEYAEVGKFDLAKAFCEQSLTITRALTDPQSEASALVNLGAVYAKLGDTSRAINYLEEGLKIARTGKYRYAEGAALHNLCELLGELRQSKSAIELGEEALAVRRSIKDQRGEAQTSKILGLLLFQEGNIERAIDLLQICVDYKRKIGHPDVAQDVAQLEQIRQRLPPHYSGEQIG